MSAMKSLGSELQRLAARLPAPRIVPAQESLINIGAGESDTPPLFMTREQLGGLGYKQVRTWSGEVAWVSPLYWMHGEPYYPPVHLPPGEERREREAAMNAAYQDYRDAKKKSGGGGRYGHDRS